MIGSEVKQDRHNDNTPASSHSSWNPHLIQGWTPDFIPFVLQEAIDNNYFDELLPVSGDQGIVWAKRLARAEGIITGISGGSTFAIAMEVAKKCTTRLQISCVCYQIQEKDIYLLPFFEDIPEEMTEEEKEISTSTPNYQL